METHAMQHMESRNLQANGQPPNKPLGPAARLSSYSSLRAVDELPQDEDGTLLRPGVVWFNENLEETVLDQVEEVLGACDLLLIVGTSSVVYPAAGYAPQVAAR